MRINRNMWQELTEQEANDAQQNYINTFSEDESFLKFIVFGKRPVRQLLSVDGCVGLKIKMGLLLNEETGKQQLFPILCAVDRFGNELPAPEESEIEEEVPEEGEVVARGGGDTNPVKCPVSCG